MIQQKANGPQPFKYLLLYSFRVSNGISTNVSTAFLDFTGCLPPFFWTSAVEIMRPVCPLINLILHEVKKRGKKSKHSWGFRRQRRTHKLCLNTFVTNSRQLISSELQRSGFGLNSFSLHHLDSPHPVDKGSQVQGHTSVRQQSWGAWVGRGCTESPRMVSVYSIDFVCGCVWLLRVCSRLPPCFTVSVLVCVCVCRSDLWWW